jgi:hypothetical protein
MHTMDSTDRHLRKSNNRWIGSSATAPQSPAAVTLGAILDTASALAKSLLSSGNSRGRTDQVKVPTCCCADR